MTIEQLIPLVSGKGVKWFTVKPIDEDEQSFRLWTKGRGKYEWWGVLSFCRFGKMAHADTVKWLELRKTAQVVDFGF